jgi:hypothetical protein
MCTCVLNQFKGHWLLSDNLKFYHFHLFEVERKIGIPISFDNFMKEESIVALDLGCLASNIRKKNYGVFKFIFWKTYEKIYGS